MKRFYLLLLAVLTLLVQSCGNQKNAELSDPTLFKDYITSYTSGMISSKGTFQVGLKNTPEDWTPNQELDGKLFSIEPNVKGKVIYLPNNTLSFTPNEALKHGEKYRITLHLSKFAEVPSELKDFHFLVLTTPLNVQVDLLDFQSLDADSYLVNGRLTASDWMSKKQVEELLQAKAANQKLKVDVSGSADVDATVFDFSISDIKRQTDVEKLLVLWDHTIDNQTLKGQVEADIPAKGVFKAFKTILDNNLDNQQSFSINFSETLKKNQDFEGLITLNHQDKIVFSTHGNLLKVSSDTPFNQNLTLTIHPGIESSNGIKTTTTETFEMNFELPKPEVRLIKSGTILPSSQNLKINFQAINLKKVDVKVYQIFENNVLQFLQDNALDSKYDLRKVASPIAKKTLELTTSSQTSRQWGSYALDLSSLIEPNPGAIYRVEFSFKRSYSNYPCQGEEAVAEEETSEDDSEENFEDEYDYYDSDFYMNYRWEERDNPCHSSYYYNREVSTNILATDLAVIAKKGSNQNYTFIVSNLITTEPVANASIEIFDYQQQLLQKLETNNTGISNILLEKTAYFAVVRKNKNTTYVRLDDGTSLSVSNFDVDGASLQKGLQGFIYSERGVWRPGDAIHLGFILDDGARQLPEKHPINLRLTDPYGKVVLQQTSFKNKENHYTFELNTLESAPTGNWEVQISVGGAKFYKRIKIETIKPNRLKIKNDIEGTVIQAGVPKTVHYQINWLQGTVAKNLKAEVQAKLRHQKTSFKGFEKYSFNNSLSSNYQEELNLFSGRTDESGAFSFVFPNIASASDTGMLQLLVTTKIHEQGGDVSTDVSSVTYAPFPSYVGIASPEGNKYGMLETGVKNSFKLQTLSARGQAIAANLQIDLYRIDSQWWWDSSDNGISNYSTSLHHQLYSNTTVRTNAQGQASFETLIPDEDWGRYELVVTNLDSGHIASQSFYIDWPYWSGKSKNNAGQEAVTLSIALDKKDYAVKDKAKISFPSSEGGRALISIENGSQVLETHWVETVKGETVFELDILENMAPNAYVNITLIQPHASTLNNAPIRLYGIVPLLVHNKASILEPVIKMPEALQPEQEFKVEVSEKSGQSMTYTIAIVEEGLLDLTRFATPRPWDSFYAKVALGVKTWDVYNDVIGAYSGTINQVFSIGGDEDLGAGKVKKANRFKPVVIFKGPFKLEKGKKASHTIKLPNYIGSVRTMVVASNVEQRAYGQTEKTTAVKKPLMVLGSLPRRVVTGEKITLPVTVFAMENAIKNVNIQLKTDSKFKVVNSSTQSLYFEEPDEKVAYFELEVGNTTGVTKVAIEVSSGREKAFYEVELDIVNPNPESFQQKKVILEPNSTTTLNWEAFGIPNSNKAVLEFSTFPGVNLNSRLNYLISYPHGCSEQITSGVFPQLYLSDFMELTAAQKSSIQKNVTKGIQKLAANQLADGSFTYWTGSRYFDDWSTSYIGHFFIEAEKKGYVLPVNSKTNWIAFQQKIARQWRFENRYGNDLAQSYRLYTLALAGSPDLASMNRLRETKGISNDTKLRLAAAYALAGQKEAALSLTNNTPWGGSANFYFGSEERNMAMALETYLSLNLKTKAHQLAIDLAERLSSNQWMSTQGTAYSLNAMSKYLKQNANSEGMLLNYNYNGVSNQVNTKRAFIENNLKSVRNENSITLENKNNTRVFVNLNYSGILPIGEELVSQSGLQLRTQFKTLTGMPLSVNSLPQGTEFSCEISITNTGNKSLTNIALTQIIPSGWEIVNLRYADAGSESNLVDHTDIRDDRTNFYFSLNPQQTKVLKVTLNASYLGHYYMPGAQANAMYDSNYQARTQGQWIDVVY